MVWLQVAVLVQVSVALQVRVTLERMGQRGMAAFVTVLTITIVTLVPSQTSTAVGAVNTTGLPHSLILSGAQLKAGGLVSTIVIVWLHDAELVQLSVTRQVRVALDKIGQRGFAALVTVLTMVMATLVPLQISLAIG